MEDWQLGLALLEDSAKRSVCYPLYLRVSLFMLGENQVEGFCGVLGADRSSREARIRAAWRNRSSDSRGCGIVHERRHDRKTQTIDILAMLSGELNDVWSEDADSESLG